MSNVKGTVEKVYCKEGKEHPTYGKSYQVSITVAGERYGAFTKKTLDELGVTVGRTVSFTWVQNGEYKNFDPKSLNVSTSVAPAAAAPAAASKGGYVGNTAGIKVGHAINNAVQLAIANKTTDLKSIHGLAVDIICLSVKLEGQFEKIVAKANAATPAAPAPAAAPAPKAAAKKAAPKKAAPPPEPEQEEVEQEAEPDGPVEPAFDDDDIPF